MNDLFPEGEYRARWTRAQEAMRHQGLDALFVTNETNVFYFSGHRPIAPWDTATRATYCILPANGDPVLVVHDVWEGGALQDSPIRPVRTYSENMEPPIASLTDCLKEMGLSRARIGAELGFEQRMGMAPNDFSLLVTATPGATWVDGAQAMWDVRAIKSPAELEYMRHACQINMSAFDTAFRRITPETTERELAAYLRTAIAEQGGELGFMAPCLTPAAYHTMSSMPSNRLLEPGKLIWTDLGSRFNMYWSDFSRAATIGRATPAQKSRWEAVNEVSMAGVALVAPGVLPSEIVTACQNRSRALGVEMNFASGRMGHGLGLMLTEPPHIAAYANEPLQAGMVITIEPGIISDEGVYIVEQDVLVTETGYEQLSVGQWEIWEIH